jgi:GMP synthase-like glutamine amidotransferase
MGPDGQKQAVGTALILAGACFGGQFVVSRAGGSVFCTSQRSKSEIPVHMTIDSKSLTLTNKRPVENCGFLYGPNGIPIKNCSSEICKHQD